MTANESKNHLQFSLWTLMAIMTVACVILAIPGGYVLLAVGTVWMLIGATIVWGLMRFQAPIYRFLSGAKLEKKRN